MSRLVEVPTTAATRRWVDVPTPQGPDIQVRWVGHTGSPEAMGPSVVRLEWRVKPSLQELEEAGVTREESDRGSA